MLEEGNKLDERFVEALEYIGLQLRNLGNAGASSFSGTEYGAIELLGMTLKESLDGVASAVEALTPQ